MSDKNSDTYDEQEAAKRRDEVVRRMANTPPQPKVMGRHPSKRKKRAGAGRAAGKRRVSREA
jgi:hypothetical protein